ncbi:MAG: MoaD/ThiS family protein [Nocardioides sp.]|uniref:MoaD/ThiS family protein n=1 Tax=Nocardioides sp. TaxID=35761 RepID=UPI0039E52820
MSGSVTVHYWAAAKAAAGTSCDELAVEHPVTLAEVRRRVLELHPDERLADVLAVCSVLVDDQPVATRDPGATLVPWGSRVEFLPPFAGG